MTTRSGALFRGGDLPFLESVKKPKALVKKIRNIKKRLPDQGVCISCKKEKSDMEHPIFEGGICQKCLEVIKVTIHANQEADTPMYCCVCGYPGIMASCVNANCSCCFCENCILAFYGQGVFIKIMRYENWLCFICDNSQYGGCLIKKENWKINVNKLFQTSNYLPKKILLPTKKRPLRVLSLFDGIGSGYFSLKKLGLVVDEYYASEIDVDALNVTNVFYNGKIKQLGKVEEITYNSLNNLGPIDLLLGGSPCNELSLVNHARKGLYDASGTGTLFFEYLRILKCLRRINMEHPFFFLFENTAAMPKEFRQDISRYLEVNPTLVNAKYFSPQDRARLFWGNIPGLDEADVTSEKNSIDVPLSQCITPFCGRTPTVDKIRTLTTKSNCLQQGRERFAPIVMNGEDDTLWVTEIEKIFGFPAHYTDVGNINPSKRLQLLGKAWSVPVICHILKPLQNYYTTF